MPSKIGHGDGDWKPDFFVKKRNFLVKKPDFFVKEPDFFIKKTDSQSPKPEKRTNNSGFQAHFWDFSIKKREISGQKCQE